MRRAWFLIASIMAVGCGGEGHGDDDDPPDGAWLARVSLGTSGNDGQIYAFMVRVSEVRLKLGSGDDIEAGPISVDALRGGVILERRNNSLPHELDVRFDQPPDGSGVLPGERVAVYVGGFIDSEPFEYRCYEMEHRQLPVGDEHVDLRFDVSTWTSGLSSASFEDAAPHQVNDDVNAAMAATLQGRIVESLQVCDQCD